MNQTGKPNTSKPLIDPIPNFSALQLNGEQEECRSWLLGKLLEVCRQLPETLEDPATFLIQDNYAGGGIQGLLDLYNAFYPPAWTIIYWLNKKYNRMTDDELKRTLGAQSLAMFLHMFDDHVVDGRIKPSHLVLQFRTHVWANYTESTNTLARKVSNGETLTKELINTYFSGIHNPPEAESMEAYKNRFRKQMATWLVNPMLLASLESPSLALLIREAFESFGLAWRLLDDLRDIQDDAAAGEATGVFHLLSAEGRELWQSCRGNTKDSPEQARLHSHISKQQVAREMAGQITGHMEDAARKATEAGLEELAGEYRTLSAPLRNLI